MTNRVGHVADQGTLLGPHFTALNTEAAIDAVRTVRVRTGGDGYRTTRADTDTQFSTSFNQHIAYAAHRVRPIGVAVWVAPGIIGGSGDGNFFLKQFIIGFEVFVGDRPIYAYTVLRVHAKI